MNEIASRENRVLEMLHRNFTSRDHSLWKQLYITSVRSHLEFASAAWNPYLISDIKTLKKVQERASRIPFSMRALEYKERLEKWNISTFQHWKRGDQEEI